jgi:hypothetical protein
MTTLAAVLPAAAALPDDDARWREWQGAYATSDRTRAMIMGALFAIAFVGVVANLVLQLV